MATPFSLEMCNLTKSMKQILEILHCFFFSHLIYTVFLNWLLNTRVCMKNNFVLSIGKASNAHKLSPAVFHLFVRQE